MTEGEIIDAVVTEWKTRAPEGRLEYERSEGGALTFRFHRRETARHLAASWLVQPEELTTLLTPAETARQIIDRAWKDGGLG